MRDRQVDVAPVPLLSRQELSESTQQVPLPDVPGEATFRFEQPVDRRARPAGARADKIGRELGRVEVPLNEALQRIERGAAQPLLGPT